MLPVQNEGTIKTINSIPCPKEPAEFSETIYDISDADAGDSQTGTMYKGYIGRKRKLQIKWNATTSQVVADLLRLFQQSTYFPVEYYSTNDAKYITRTFVVDDREIQTIQMIPGREVFSLSLSLTTRSVEP